MLRSSLTTDRVLSWIFSYTEIIRGIGVGFEQGIRSIYSRALTREQINVDVIVWRAERELNLYGN